MTFRVKLLQAATAALYMGPLLAGLAGYGWAMVPPFLSIFLWWLVVLHPHKWPQRNAEWLGASAWIALLAQLTSQLLLVAMLFAIGRGLGGALGHLPLFHPALPVAISFIAIPLSRLVWNPEEALKLGLTVDEVLYPRQRPAAPLARVMTGPVLTPQEAIRPLLAFAGNAALQDVGPALEDALDDDAAWARLSALGEALDSAPGQHRSLREALVIWTTAPEVFAASAAPSAMRLAFRAAGTDLGLLSRLMPRAAALARLLPQNHGQFPESETLQQLAALPLPAQVARDLIALQVALGHRSAAAPGAAGAEAGVVQGGFLPA